MKFHSYQEEFVQKVSVLKWFFLSLLGSIELKDWLTDEEYKSAGGEQWFGSVHFSGPCDLKVLSALLGFNIDRQTHRNTHNWTHSSIWTDPTQNNTLQERDLEKLFLLCCLDRVNPVRPAQMFVFDRRHLQCCQCPKNMKSFLSLALSCLTVHTCKLPSTHPSLQQTLLNAVKTYNMQ